MTLRLGRIAGTDIEARPSLLLAAGALILLIAPRYAPVDSQPYVVAAALVLGLYVSILVHELAHLAVAKAYRMRVRAVTLHLMGGETSIVGGSRNPVQEIVTAGVGPVASALIGVSAHGVAGVVNGVAADVWWSLGWLNLLLAGFNLLPGLPLDGGRVVRGLAWAATGSQRRGWWIAAWTGRATAIVVLVGVVALRWTGPSWDRTIVDLLLAVFVAGFLWLGSSAALQYARR